MEEVMLVVDDDQVNREVLSLLFQEQYLVLEAESGREALDVLESCNGNIDVVLLDLLMPDMNGLELLQRRQSMADFSRVPVVVITSSSDVEDQVKAFQLGANDLIFKPFIPEIVRSRIANVMASRQRLALAESEAKRLRVKSEIDQMTGLFNKTTVESMITETLFREQDSMHALMVLDIDNFKSVNDMQGHQAGDHTIRIVANTISGQFRKSDIVGRVGGDEFVVLMTNIPSMEIAREKAVELARILKYKPNLTLPANVSLSIGLAECERGKLDYAELFNRADEALYDAKKLGKARVVEYGVVPTENDDQNDALLMIGRNRGVCSLVNALAPKDCRVLEALSTDALAGISPQDASKVVLALVDVSDCSDSSADVWQKVRTCEWLQDCPILAVCAEGNILQFKEALQNGAADILTAPLDGSAFKRRVERFRQKRP